MKFVPKMVPELGDHEVFEHDLACMAGIVNVANEVNLRAKAINFRELGMSGHPAILERWGLWNRCIVTN